MPELTGAYLRQDARQALNLVAEFVISEQHAGQVRFSPVSRALKPNITRAKATDLSSGGLGLVSTQFLPRLCEGTVRIFAAAADGGNTDADDREMLFEHRAKVRRVVLSSPEPTYSLGLAFINAEGDIEKRVEALKLRAAAVHDASPAKQGDPSA